MLWRRLRTVWRTIALVKEHKPDLLLLDAAMPLARGVQVFGEARRWSPDTRVAVVTGFTSVGMLADWMAAEVDGLFLKSCLLYTSPSPRDA